MSLTRGRIPALYALTPGAGDLAGLSRALDELVDAGVRWIQVREKNVPDGLLAATIGSIRPNLPTETLLIINDRVDIAIASGAGGVHLGDRDLPAPLARSIAGKRDMIIGVSTHSAEEAVEASRDPAVDYVALGPIYASSTKSVRSPLGADEIRRARERIADKPIVAIGGIDAANIGEVLTAGADSAAVIAALYRPGAIGDNVRALLEASEIGR